MTDFSAKRWLSVLLLGLGVCLFLIAGVVWFVDPYFVYRSPRVDRFHYVLDNARWQNPGIMKQFDFDCMMVGSSMTQNFRSSDISRVFACRAIRFPYEGAGLCEYREAVLWGCAVNTNLSSVVVCLDADKMLLPADWRPVRSSGIMEAFDSGNLLAQARYLLYADAVAKSFCALFDRRNGITDFDDYQRTWREDRPYGRAVVMKNYRYVSCAREQLPVDEALRRLVSDGIEKNILPIVRTGKRVVFFVPPYSLVKSYVLSLSGMRDRYLYAEQRYVVEILRHGNARVFSWNDRVGLVGDLENYSDPVHYVASVNDLILDWMAKGDGEITTENCESYFAAERKLVEEFDYETLFR